MQFLRPSVASGAFDSMVQYQKEIEYEKMRLLDTTMKPEEIGKEYTKINHRLSELDRFIEFVNEVKMLGE